MSVLGRVRRAATELLDLLAVEAARDPALAPAADEDAGARPEQDRRVVAIARMLGAPDPFALVDPSDAAVAVGAPVGPPRLTHGDDSVGVIHAGGSPALGAGAVSVSAFHAADEDAQPFDADAHWHGFLAPALADEAVAVDGVGRAALRTRGGLYVLGGSHVLYLTLRRPDGRPGDEQLAALARTTLLRLEG